MSGDRNLWQAAAPPGFITSEPTAASISGNSGSALPFRPNAPSFTPRGSFLNIRSPELAEQHSHASTEHSSSSHYHLLGSTFMPPETPPIVQSPFPNSGNPQDRTAPSVAKIRQDLQTSLTHVPEAIHQQDPFEHKRYNEVLHSRGNSDLISVSACGKIT